MHCIRFTTVPTIQRQLHQRPGLTHHLPRGAVRVFTTKRQSDYHWTGHNNVALSHGVRVEQDAIRTQWKMLT